MTANLATASITSTGSTQTRTLGARFSDIINVKDYGATGNGSTDDRVAIQAAFDAAFGSSGSPHGSSGKFNNKAVFFPNGDYRVSSPGLTLTDVDGGYIFGAGLQATRITLTSGSGIYLLNVNGMINSRMERMWLDGGSSNGGLDLDYTGTSGLGLNNNFFSDINLTGAPVGIRIAQSGNDGASNTFFNVTVGGYAGGTGLKIVGTNATGNNYYSAGGDTCAIGIQVVGGQMANIIGSSWGLNVTTVPIKIDNASECSIQGGRTESPNFLQAGTARVHMAGVGGFGSTGYMVDMTNPGVVICESCYFSGTTARKTITGTGFLYLRGNYYVDTASSGAAPAAVVAGFSGTKVQDI